MKPGRIFAAMACAALLFGCGDEPRRGEEPQWRLTQERAVSFSDGQYADLWERDFFGAWHQYRLPDGTALLEEHEINGPENVVVIGQQSLADLNEAAQQKVVEFYHGQGPLYDTEAELQRAYRKYLQCMENGEKFEDVSLRQEISPTSSNDRIICFITIVSLPTEGPYYYELRQGAAFDRETGEHIGGWELFALPEDEIRARFGELFSVENPHLAEQMGAALKPEYIILFPESVEIAFPRGTLEGWEYGHLVGVEYDKLAGVLHDWAMMPAPERR